MLPERKRSKLLVGAVFLACFTILLFENYLYNSTVDQVPFSDQYVKLLQRIFFDDRFQTFVDLGSSNFASMRLMNVPREKTYTGIDTVEESVRVNKRKYNSHRYSNYFFHHLVELMELKFQFKGDLLIVNNEFLNRFSNSEIQYFIDNILSNFKYALITSQQPTEDASQLNSNLISNSQDKFRPIDLTFPPFDLKNTDIVLQHYSSKTIVYFYTNPNL